VYAIAWLQTKFHFEKSLKHIGGRVAGLAHRTKRHLAAIVQRVQRRMNRTTQQSLQLHEMQTQGPMNDNSSVLMTID
jgi:phosphotransacetylase